MCPIPIRAEAGHPRPARMPCAHASSTSSSSGAARWKTHHLMEPALVGAAPPRLCAAWQVASIAVAAAERPDMTRVGELAAYVALSVRALRRSALHRELLLVKAAATATVNRHDALGADLPALR